jgi:hypothetical protein
MRQFLVLGFKTNSGKETGEQVHLGADRGKAIEVTNKPDAFTRKELFELATPHITRHFGKPEPKKPAKKKAAA